MGLKNKRIMDIEDFVSQFTSHPVLFVGTGMTKRFLEESYTWPELLSSLMIDIDGHDERFLSLLDDYKFDYAKVGTVVEEIVIEYLKNNRDGVFQDINDEFYNTLRSKHISINRFKLLISKKLSKIDLKEDKKEELELFKSLSGNIKSVITTNYDKMLETLFDLTPVIGNNLLMTSQYGSIYKIHGCVTNPNTIILTSTDYDHFKYKEDLIRAQLISLFIYNPVVFLGYGSNDPNIERTLQTIFKYVGNRRDIIDRLKKNFLIVNYDKGSTNRIVTPHDKTIDDTVISINELKTDDYISLFRALKNTPFSAEAGVLKLVQNVWDRVIVKNPQVSNKQVAVIGSITDLKASDLVIAIIDKNQVESVSDIVKRVLSPLNSSDLVNNYFTYSVEDSDTHFEGKITVAKKEYFPVYKFENCNFNIYNLSELKEKQNERLENLKTLASRGFERCKGLHDINFVLDIDSILESTLPITWKNMLIIYYSLGNNVDLDRLEAFIMTVTAENKTFKRKLLCIYDFKKYSKSEVNS